MAVIRLRKLPATVRHNDRPPTRRANALPKGPPPAHAVSLYWTEPHPSITLGWMGDLRMLLAPASLRALLTPASGLLGQGTRYLLAGAFVAGVYLVTTTVL